MRNRIAWAALLLLAIGAAAAAAPADDLFPGGFRWTYGPPLVGPASRPADPCYSVKDPSIVRYDGRWHLFCTIRSQKRSHQIEYSSFADWKDADAAERHILTVSDGYFCAPQVFYFEPHRKWYMVLQVTDPTRKPALQPAYCTTDNIADPASWSKPQLLFDAQPANVKAQIDFWVICDDRTAYLFFTGNDGLMWRAEAKLADFPRRWSEPTVALRGDVFEASHTYRLKRRDQYLTIIEAIDKQAGGRRYYKAYLADRLDGEWKPLADSRERPFAGAANARPAPGAEPWAESISHGELLRDGYDQRLEVDPARLRLLFQGVTDRDMKGKKYGEIPWRLGILDPSGGERGL